MSSSLDGCYPTAITATRSSPLPQTNVFPPGRARAYGSTVRYMADSEQQKQKKGSRRHA